MSSETNPPPFQRRQINWGRPPATVFLTGALPAKTETGHSRTAAVPAQPAQPVPATPPGRQAGILTGSMIPRAQPRPGPAAASGPEAPSAPVSAIATAPVVSTPTPPLADLTVRPLPPAAPEKSPEQAVSDSPPTSHDQVPSGRSRGPLYAAVAAGLAAAGLFGLWLMTRTPAAPVSTDATVAANLPEPAQPEPAQPAPVIPVAEDTTLPVEAPLESPAPVTAARPVAEGTAALATATTAAAERPPVPSANAPSPIVVTVPRETPAVVSPAPAPTSAESPPSDPDAPIVTRAQARD